MSCGHRRPLEACGVSFFAIAQKAYAKAQDLNGPFGSVTKKTTRLASAAVSPLLGALRCQLLVAFAFADDYILALETEAENIFPPLKHIFDKTDHLIKIVETLPERFDNAVNKLPVLIQQQAPLLDWALVHAISCLNFLISILTHWRSYSHGTKEKEIVVDKDYSKRKRKSASANRAQSMGKASPTRIPKSTYKEVLEKGMKGKGDETEKASEGGGRGKSKGEDTNLSKRDQILELFESAWLMRSRRKGTNNKLWRSVSCT